MTIEPVVASISSSLPRTGAAKNELFYFVRIYQLRKIYKTDSSFSNF